MPRSTSHTRRLAVLALLSASFAAVSAAPASAASAGVCEGQTFTQAFFAFDGDRSWYTLFSGGDFESAPLGWTLSGGAYVVNDRDAVSGTRSVVLPPSGSVTTAPLCVSHGYPYARMYGRTDVPSVKNDSSVQVRVVYTDVNGRKQAKSMGKVTQLDRWRATKKMSLAQGQLDIAPTTTVQLRFTADARSTWRLDDIYMDPRMRG